MKKRLIILGCTGSIGTTAVQLIRQLPDLFEIVGLSAHNDSGKLAEIALEFGVTNTALTGSTDITCDAKYFGQEGLSLMLKETEAEMVLHGISGAAGLQYSIEALKQGKDIALANKESVVMAGRILFDLARSLGREIIPVDSEHSAIYQLLRYRPKDIIRKVILTASGGPFRTLSAECFSAITVEEALQHPTWVMGPKITIDSATLANKGLEIIETSRFFSLEPSRISVVIHPQSIVHSMVETIEGSLYAQMSRPSMKLPILNAISYPEIIGSCYEPFSLAGKTLTFDTPDYERFPMLEYAFESLNSGDALPIVYNAANEVAVEAFLEKRVSFTEIPRLVYEVLNLDWGNRIDSFEAVYETDMQARRAAGRLLQYI